MPPLLIRSLRSWKNAKGSAALAVMALSVGIGSTTAIYTLLNGVLLKPVQYSGGERFVTLFSAATNDPHIGSSTAADLMEYKERARSFDLFGWQPFSACQAGTCFSRNAIARRSGVAARASHSRSIPSAYHLFSESSRRRCRCPLPSRYR